MIAEASALADAAGTDPAAARRDLMQVRDLAVEIETDLGIARAVRGVSFEVRRGEFLGVVGESGSGKSVTFLSVLGLLPTLVSCRIAGRSLFEGQDLSRLAPGDMRRLLGAELSIVFQDPLAALNPVFRIGHQIADVVRAHEPSVSAAEARRRAIEVLERVRIPNAAARASDYPHQFSGGMRQRVLIAMAIVCGPKLLIADEPTTALDVTVQAEILALLDQLRRELEMSVVLITHDLGLVARYADRVAVMYAGRIVEQGTVADLFRSPAHPYTRALLLTVPRIGPRLPRLAAIAGEAPSVWRVPSGCAFEPRCTRSRGRSACTASVPPLNAVEGRGHVAACHFANEVEAAARVSPAPASRSDGKAPQDVVLEVEGLSKQFELPRGRGVLRAVSDVTFELGRGETLGIVGESGSGKSTLARCILQLVPPTSGRVRLEGTTIEAADQASIRLLRERMQLVFQDSRSALNPRMTVEAIVGEPLVIRGQWRQGGAERVARLLARVGLSPEHAGRYPHESSGGQQQRVGIARALILHPAVVVLDEPISSLDVSIRAQILNLLEELQAEFGLSYLFIAHDLSVVHHISDRIAVMYRGRIVEIGTADRVCLAPVHPYTQLLIESVPDPDPATARSGTPDAAPAGPPDPVGTPSGCAFRGRCRRATAVAATGLQPSSEVEGRRLPVRCIQETPALSLRADGSRVACHFAD